MGNNKKLPKDPNAPKMPKRPFIYFSMEVGKDVREELSKDPSFMGNEVNFQQQGKIAKACGIKWNALSESEKEKYNMMYREDIKRYQEEMKSYTPSQEHVEKVKRAKLRNQESAAKKTNTDMTKVSHMVKAYFEYLTTTWSRVAASNTRLNPQQVQEEVWKRWSNGESGGRDTRWDENRNLQENPRKRKREKSNFHGNMPTQPKQAFQCFLEQMKGELRKHLPDLPYSEVVKHVSAKWKDMSNVEKEPFFVQEKDEKEKSGTSEGHNKNVEKEVEYKDSSIKEDFAGLSPSEQNENNKEDKVITVDAQKTEIKGLLKESDEADEESSTSLIDDDFQIHYEEDDSNVNVQKDKDEEMSKTEVNNTHGVNPLPPSSSSCSDDSSDDDSDTTSSDSESNSD